MSLHMKLSSLLSPADRARIKAELAEAARLEALLKQEGCIHVTLDPETGKVLRPRCARRVPKDAPHGWLCMGHQVEVARGVKPVEVAEVTSA
jgi:hypothetical protein